MIAAWIARALVTAALIAIAGRAAQEVVATSGRPRRWVWAVAIALASGIPTLAWYRPQLFWSGAELLPMERLLALLAHAASYVGVLFTSGTGSGPGTAADLAAQTLPTLEPMGLSLAGWMAAAEVVLLVLWVAASVLLLVTFSWAHLRIRVARAGARAADIEGMRVLVTDRMGPAAVGLLRPTVVIPPWVLAVAPEERRLILVHEREHVRAGDTWLLRAAALPLLLLPWCLPLWWMYRRLREAVEIDCDARVLASRTDTRTYVSMLLQTAARPAAPLLSSPALGRKQPPLERRICAMTLQRPKHLALRTLPPCALAAVAVIAACDAASPPITQPEGTRPTEVSSPLTQEQSQLTWEPGDTGPNARIWTRSRPLAAAIERALGEIDPTEIESVEVVKEPSQGGSKKATLLINVEGPEPGVALALELVQRAKSIESQEHPSPDAAEAEAERRLVRAQLRLERARGGPPPSSGGSDASAARRLVRLERFSAAQAAIAAGLSRDPSRPAVQGQPLIFVDGIRVPGSPGLDALDPDDIARIEVVKGPAAVAMYGADASGGVILVSTK